MSFLLKFPEDMKANYNVWLCWLIHYLINVNSQWKKLDKESRNRAFSWCFKGLWLGASGKEYVQNKKLFSENRYWSPDWNKHLWVNEDREGLNLSLSFPWLLWFGTQKTDGSGSDSSGRAGWISASLCSLPHLGKEKVDLRSSLLVGVLFTCFVF